MHSFTFNNEKNLGKQTTLIIGRKPVLDSIKSGKNIDSVYMWNSLRGPYEVEMRKLCSEREIPLKKIPKERMPKHTNAITQGIIAYMSLVQYQKLDDLIPFWFEKGVNPIVLILDGITDVRNIGAIARSAEVFQASAIVVHLRKTAQLNEKAVKSSAGALLDIPICRVTDLKAEIKKLEDYGFEVYGTSLKADKFIYETDLKNPVGIVMGAEGEGINPDLERKLSKFVKIPQFGKIDSLNVSVACGVVLYEIQKQRKIDANA